MAKIKIEYRKLEALKAYDRNARVHTPSQIQQIANSIQQFGFNNPVLVDSSNEIIAGHGRFEAAKLLWLDQVPVIVLGHLSEHQKRAYVLADNRIQLSATWDMDRLSSELIALAEAEIDVTVTGFTDSELETLMQIDPGFIPEITDVPVFSRDSGEAEKHTLPVIPPDVPTHHGEPAASPEPEQRRQPRATDDDYSTFELVMEHSNKVELINKLQEIKHAKFYEKLEEALMELVRKYPE